MILKKEKKKGSPSSAYNIQYIETKMKEEQKNKRKDSNKEKRKKEKKIWFTQNRTLVTEQGALAVPPCSYIVKNRTLASITRVR